MLGNFARFMLIFFLGKYLEKEFFLNRDFRYSPKAGLLRAEQRFQRFGYLIILFNRIFSGARSVISIFAGIAEWKTAKVAIYSLISCLVWNGMLIYAGYKAGENWQNSTTFLKQYNKLVLFVIIAGLAMWAFRGLLKRIRKPAQYITEK